MYFTYQIRQIKLKKKITEEGPLKKMKKEEEEEDFQRVTKEKRDLCARRGLQQHGESRTERRDERREGAGLCRAER